MFLNIKKRIENSLAIFYPFFDMIINDLANYIGCGENFSLILKISCKKNEFYLAYNQRVISMLATIWGPFATG
jgi:hypothetical protein